MTKGRWILAGIVVAGVAFATVQGLRPRPPPPVDVTTSGVLDLATTLQQQADVIRIRLGNTDGRIERGDLRAALLFAPLDTLDFDKVVFNTEAHPLRRTW